MRIVEAESDFGKIKKGSVLTIGNFDGLHVGHCQILRSAKKIAEERNTDLTVMTFDPHPAAILRPEQAPGILTPLEFKKHLLAREGVDCLVVLKDTYKLLNLSPGEFVNEFVMANVRSSVVVEGPNFNFGYGRSGTVETLKTLGKKRGFEVVIVPGEKVQLSDGSIVTASSSLVRSQLERAEAADAAMVLHRPYRLIGQVVAGRGKGRYLGFPTANLEPVGQIIPAEAVYAGYVVIADSMQQICQSSQRQRAVFSIGRAKTLVTNHPLLIEAHILDAAVGRLQGKWMGMDFIKHIRSQEIFKTEDDLKKQIQKDCRAAKEILTQNEEGFLNGK